MAFCSSCGSEVEGKFCAKCGAAQESAPPPAYGSAASTAAPPQLAQAGMEENLASALCYVFGLLTGVLFLVLAPYNQNRVIRFHAFQSIFLHVASIAVFIALAILVGIMHFIPFLGTFLGMLLYPAVGIGLFILWVMLMYKAYNKERWVLPIIGELAEKQA